MPDSLAAIVLAAGSGERLRPLTWLRPKALCPIANVPMIDLALAKVHHITEDVAVNVHHGREMMEAYLFGGVHLSIEHDRALGTAGALGRLREWIAGRAVLVLNVDAWHLADMATFVAGWDGDRVRILVAGEAARGLRPDAQILATLMPWWAVRDLVPEPSGLYEVSWRPLAEQGRVETTSYSGPFVDCGTPTDYLTANMLASGGTPVVGKAAQVDGELERAVVWPAGIVRGDERLVDAIRVGDRLTILCR